MMFTLWLIACHFQLRCFCSEVLFPVCNTFWMQTRQWISPLLSILQSVYFNEQRHKLKLVFKHRHTSSMLPLFHTGFHQSVQMAYSRPCRLWGWWLGFGFGRFPGLCRFSLLWESGHCTFQTEPGQQTMCDCMAADHFGVCVWLAMNGIPFRTSK